MQQMKQIASSLVVINKLIIAKSFARLPLEIFKIAGADLSACKLQDNIVFSGTQAFCAELDPGLQVKVFLFQKNIHIVSVHH